VKGVRNTGHPHTLQKGNLPMIARVVVLRIPVECKKVVNGT
jgi:hypothetical protein